MGTSHSQGQTIRIWCTMLPTLSSLTLTNTLQPKKCGNFLKYLCKFTYFCMLFLVVSHNESSVHGYKTFKIEEKNSWEDSGLDATFTRNRFLGASTFQCGVLLWNCLHLKKLLATQQYCGASASTQHWNHSS